MKTTIIIQARMNSTRLPGKVLKKIGGTPIINLIIKRLSRAKLVDDIIVATSKIKENQILINYLKKIRLNYFVEVKAMYYRAFIKRQQKINQK